MYHHYFLGTQKTFHLSHKHRILLVFLLHLFIISRINSKAKFSVYIFYSVRVSLLSICSSLAEIPRKIVWTGDEYHLYASWSLLLPPNFPMKHTIHATLPCFLALLGESETIQFAVTLPFRLELKFYDRILFFCLAGKVHRCHRKG